MTQEKKVLEPREDPQRKPPQESGGYQTPTPTDHDDAKDVDIGPFTD